MTQLMLIITWLIDRMTLALNNETTIGSVSDVLNSGMKIYAESGA